MDDQNIFKRITVIFSETLRRSRFNRTRRALLQIRKRQYCHSFRGYGADYGKCLSKKETYFGYKVHALITLEGYITAFEIAQRVKLTNKSAATVPWIDQTADFGVVYESAPLINVMFNGTKPDHENIVFVSYITDQQDGYTGFTYRVRTEDPEFNYSTKWWAVGNVRRESNILSWEDHKQ